MLLIVMYAFGIWPFGSREPASAIAENTPAEQTEPQQRPEPQPRQSQREPESEPVVQQPPDLPEEITQPEPEPTPEPTVEQPSEQPERAESTRDANTKVDDMLTDAKALVEADSDSVIEARDMLNDALSLQMNQRQEEQIREYMEELSDKWLFSSKVYPGDDLAKTYNVQPGDLLQNIGRKFNTPWEILGEINNIIRPEALRAGQNIKVVNGPFHCKVDRTNFTLDLYLQDTFVRRFDVGLGKAGMETPTGLWMVELGGKLIKPRWTDPVSGNTYEPTDPDYPLGSRWIALKGIEGNAVGRTGFAIHGTNEPETIGTQSSQGCIRLENGEAILIYNVLTPGHSEVRVFDS